MTAIIGRVQEFVPETEALSAYLERLQLFFDANNIAEDRKVSVLLTVIGVKNYALLRSLVAPSLPRDKTFDELVLKLKAHFEPKPLVIAERFHFYRRSQEPDESVLTYIAELRRLTARCEFGAFLDEALRDRFVCGLRSENIQKRLLSEDKLTISKALDIAQAMESADRNAKELKRAPAAVLSVSQPKSRKPCYRCGRTNHDDQECRFRDATCHNCGKTGHIATVCRTKKTPTRSQSERRKPFAKTSRAAKWVAEDDAQRSDSEEIAILTIGKKSGSQPIQVGLTVEGKQLTMEVDTGAAVSLISEHVRKSMFPTSHLRKSNVVLRTYTGERVSVLGELPVEVQYGDQQPKVLTLLVVEGAGPCLLGRNWLAHICLDWKTIGAVSMQSKSPECLEALLSQHSEIFSEELGTIREIKAKLAVQENARPKFCKPRNAPFALKEAIERELDRLEGIGVLNKVSYSDWAAPIVPVPKKDGSIRICGDYKVTINPVLDIDQYPLPKPEDLFATLAGGKKFTTLDLSNAYLQLPLDEKCRKYVTVNTHKGLYCYTRLPFGVASAPAIFQKTMDTILQGITGVICYIDDILVTGATDAKHLKTLGEVFERLQQYGVRMKRAKCKFMQPSVEFLGHRIDAEGCHTTEDKVRAILEAPSPRNVQELRSFLGMLNYYGKFISNLCSILHPLNQLLRKDRQWDWTEECSHAFQSAKEQLTSSTVLAHYDPSLPMKLAADASAYGVGAVISHVMPDGAERPIAFASRTLTSSEKNYAQVEKEALALIFGVKKFHAYLYGREFTLVTDHKPLISILGPKKGIPPLAAACLQRWALLLSAHKYQVEFRPTEKHANADGLSRLPLTLKGGEGSSSEPGLFNVNQINALPVTARVIQGATRKDPQLSAVLRFTQRGWPAQVPEELKPFHIRRHEITTEEECLLWGMRVLIPKPLQGHMLEELHQDHPGVARMKALARSHVWWPGLDRDLESLAKSCVACQSVNQAPPVAPLRPWVWPTKPWERIHIDFAGPFQGKMYLIAVDAHSKWPEVYEMAQTTATKTITVLRHLFSTYGLPEQVVSDNGPQFTSEEFATFMKANGIKHVRVAPYHPASNGLAERFVRTFKQAMRTGKHDGLTPSHRLENFLLTYRSTPHATTGETPCSLFLGRIVRTRFDLLRPSLERRVGQKQVTQKEKHDQHAR